MVNHLESEWRESLKRRSVRKLATSLWRARRSVHALCSSFGKRDEVFRPRVQVELFVSDGHWLSLI